MDELDKKVIDHTKTLNKIMKDHYKKVFEGFFRWAKDTHPSSFGGNVKDEESMKVELVNTVFAIDRDKLIMEAVEEVLIQIKSARVEKDLNQQEMFFDDPKSNLEP